MTEYVTTADALFFHKVLIERYGGSTGVRDVGALEAALHRPQTGYYDTIVHEAAALFESLLQTHPFIDGNKRTAFIAMELFLDLNGFELNASDEDCVLTMLGLAGGQLDEEALAGWIRDRLAARNA